MFKIIVYFIVLVVIVLIGAYFYVEQQRRKVEEENKKARALRIATMKHNFKLELVKLVESEVLSIKEQEVIFQIANNFFVFQPVTNNSIDYCEQLLINVIDAIRTAGPENIQLDLLQEHVRSFARALPTAAGGYNGRFYRNELPNLIKKLLVLQEQALFNVASDISNEPLIEDVIKKPVKASSDDLNSKQ